MLPPYPNDQPNSNERRPNAETPRTAPTYTYYGAQTPYQSGGEGNAYSSYSQAASTGTILEGGSPVGYQDPPRRRRAQSNNAYPDVPQQPQQNVIPSNDVYPTSYQAPSPQGGFRETGVYSGSTPQTQVSLQVSPQVSSQVSPQVSLLTSTLKRVGQLLLEAIVQTGRAWGGAFSQIGQTLSKAIAEKRAAMPQASPSTGYGQQGGMPQDSMQKGPSNASSRYSMPADAYQNPNQNGAAPYSRPLQETRPYDQSYGMQSMQGAPGLQQPFSHYHLKTDRGLLKYILLSIITLGIYGIIAVNGVGEDINTTAHRYDGKQTLNYWLVIFILGPFTFMIFLIIWWHSLCNRMQKELERRRIPYRFGAGSYWGWNVLGAFVIVGPFVFMYKLFKASNYINEHYNQFG